MDASVFPPPPYSDGWPPHPGMHPSFRPEFPSTSNMMPFPPGMNPNEPVPNIEPGSQPPMSMPMIPPSGIFPQPGYGPMGFPSGMQRFPGPANFTHQMSPGFPQNGINSPSVNEFGQNQSPFDQGSNSTSNTPLKNQNGSLPFSPNTQNGFDPSKSQPSRFLFTSKMANEAVQAVRAQQFENMAAWHIASYPSTSQASMNGVVAKDSAPSRGVKRKASSHSLDHQSQSFNPDMGPGSANPDFNNAGNPFSNENASTNNDFMRPSSAKSDGVTSNENDPLRCIQRMTEQVDEAPASKISRTSSETLNDKNKRNNQETNDKLRRLNEIESKLLKQPALTADGQPQRLPPYFAGPFGPRMPFMHGGPMPMGPQGPYDPQMMAAMQRPPYASGVPPGPYPIGPNGMPMMPGGMMHPQAGPRGMMPPNAMPGNFHPNMFPSGPGPMHSPSFGAQMTPASSTTPQMMPFPPGSVASPGPMGEPGMPPPYHMPASAGVMQQSPRFPGPAQGMPPMGPNGMIPPGMMAMRPGFPNDMGMIRGACPPDGFNGWSPHQMPQPLTNLESRVPSGKVSYMPQK